MSDLKISRRKLPHWELEGATYYVTFRLASGSLTEDERRVVLAQVMRGRGRYYDLNAAVVMPDHVHLLIKPLPGASLTRIMNGIKAPSARAINRRRDSKGRVWQDERWDRIVRDQEEFVEKFQYMLNNPVKAGLVGDPLCYDGWYGGEG